MLEEYTISEDDRAALHALAELAREDFEKGNIHPSGNSYERFKKRALSCKKNHTVGNV